MGQRGVAQSSKKISFDERFEAVEVRLHVLERKHKHLSDSVDDKSLAIEKIELAIDDIIVRRLGQEIEPVVNRVRNDIFEDLNKALNDTNREKSKIQRKLEERGVKIEGRVGAPMLALLDA